MTPKQTAATEARAQDEAKVMLAKFTDALNFGRVPDMSQFAQVAFDSSFCICHEHLSLIPFVCLHSCSVIENGSCHPSSFKQGICSQGETLALSLILTTTQERIVIVIPGHEVGG